MTDTTSTGPQIENAAELLAELRWSADTIVTNDFGERVWLRKCEHGITDCCLASEPCDEHALLTHQAPKAKQ